jgi:phosphatidylglycerol:prolipoprotein diacylglycerol transferase
VIFFWPELEGNILNAFMIQRGGLVFYGGLALALIAILWRSARYKLSLFKLFDIASLSAAIGYSIARIGCFLNGCCYGVESNLPWAVQFPGLLGKRHPTELYASATMLILFLLLLIFWKRRKFDGQIFLFAVICYSIYRFLIEFIRVNPKYLLNLTSAQWASVVLFVLAAGTLIWRNVKIPMTKSK